MKIKKLRGVLFITMVLSLIMAMFPFAPISAAGEVITLDAPAYVAADGGFNLTINITGATNLKNYELFLNFDPDVVDMAGVELATDPSSGIVDGVINGVTIPNFGWTYQPTPGTPSGTVKTAGNLQGNNSVSGNGSLAIIHLKAKGTAGSQTTLSLSSILLGDLLGNETSPDIPDEVTINISDNPAEVTSVTTGEATGVTETTATLHGTLTSLGTAGSVDLFLGYSTRQGGPYTYVAGPAGASTVPLQYQTNLTGLTQNTTYYCVAIAEYGTETVFGAEETFTTTAISTLPTLVSLNPSSGIPGAVLNGVVITGTKLTGATALTFSGSGVTASNIVVTNSTQITATITINGAAALGSRNVTVTAAAGTSEELVGGFAVTSPGAAIISLDAPAYVAADGGFNLAINITGATNLKNYQLLLNFDPDVVDMAGVELATDPSSGIVDGVINGVTLPNFGWTYQPDPGTPTGTVKTAGNLQGNNSVSGNGSLAIIHLKAKGAAGTQTTLGLSSILLGDSLGEETYPANPSQITVNISSDPNLVTSVTTGAATAVTETTATLHGTLTSLGTAGSVDLYLGYSIQQGGPYTYIAGPAGASTVPLQYQTNLIGLTQHTTYYCVAIAEYGTETVFGTEETFTTLGSAVPTLVSLNPNFGVPGDILDGVVITGTKLTGATALTFSGSGVTASNIVVTNSTQITATITIDGAAALGSRNVTVTAAAGTSEELVGGFTVTSPGAAIVSLDAPAYVAENSGFYVTVNVTGVSNLKNFSLKSSFDPGVVDMAGQELITGIDSGIIDGEINGITIPNDGWSYQPYPGTPSGTIMTLGNLSGDNSVSGSGSLLTFNLKVTGAAGTSTTLSLSDILIGDRLGNESVLANPDPVTITISSDPLLVTKVTTDDATGVTNSSATLNGTLESLGQADSVNLSMGYSTLPGGPYTYLAGPENVDTAPLSFQAYATSLLPNTTYYYVAIAQNGTITVTGAEMTFKTAESAFTPAIDTITPDSGNQGEVLNGVVITGTNLTGATAINFSGDGVTADNITVVNDSQITFTIIILEDATPGPRNVTVIAAGGTSNPKVGGFTVLGQGTPTVTSITPNSGYRGSTYNVTINGTNMTGATAVNFSGTGLTASNIVVVSDTQITASVAIASSATTGARNVSVTNAAGTGAALTGAFTVRARSSGGGGGGSSITYPRVVSTVPAKDATDVAVSSAIKATFSMDMNSSTLTSANFIVKKDSQEVSGTIAYDAATKTATFTPTAALDYSTKYTVTITTGVKNTSNRGIESNYTWNFTTGVKPPVTTPPVTTPPVTTPPVTTPPVTTPPVTTPPVTPTPPNTGLIVGIIIAALVVIAIVVWLIIRNRRKIS